MSRDYYLASDLETWLESKYRPQSWLGLDQYLDEIRELLSGLESDNRQSLVLLAAIEAVAKTAMYEYNYDNGGEEQ